MESLRHKKILSGVIFFCFYLLYLTIRLNSIIYSRNGYDVLSSYRNSYINFDIKHLVIKCRNFGPMMMYFDDSGDMKTNAQNLMTSQLLNTGNICSSRIIYLSQKETCSKMDLRLFIQLYFKETLKADFIFKKYRMKKNYENDDYYYALYNDKEAASKNPNHQKDLETLGFMIALALATETYLDVKFADHFYQNQNQFNKKNLLDEELEYVNPDQNKIYKGGYYNFDFQSDKPFTNYSYFRYNPEYKSLLSASDAIFKKPFEKSYDSISKGFQIVLQGNGNFFNLDYDMKRIFSQRAYDQNINILNWKGNSDYSFATITFWKALSDMSFDKKLQVYEKVTGNKYVPVGGFGRLPKTKILACSDLDACDYYDKFMFTRPYEVRVRPYISVPEMIEDILENLRE